MNEGVFLNHIALSVQNLPVSAHFYGHVLQLPPLPEPFKIGRHAWFKIGQNLSLHLIAGAAQPSFAPIDAHLAFTVPDLVIFADRLRQLKVAYQSVLGERETFTIRPDGIRQLFLQDPDGYWLEVNDEKMGGL